eukprot:Nitzschia sp. Nitz4//scaffold47_size129522//112524//113774//NITZ4_003568-RA/size129522-processed-gene-0.175-mRNA-1//-1//CDS//3329552851//7759//frame0
MVTPTTVSPPTTGSSSNNVGMPFVLHTMLSQLSFTVDVPPVEWESSNEALPWPSLLLLDHDDDGDLFFDAQQEDEKDSTTSSSNLPQESPTHVTDFSFRGGELPPSPTSTPVNQAATGDNHAIAIPHLPPSQSSLPPQAHPPPLSPYDPLPSPPPPLELPLRFLRAGKGDPVEGERRYQATLAWRREFGMDRILMEPHPDFFCIKQHYPHYYHLKGRLGEPVFFEQPPKTDLAALRRGGVTLDNLLRHYAMVTEFQWQWIERRDDQQSITVLDLEGMRFMDFVGECVEYVKSCSAFTGQHYPERAGHVFVIHTPGWFNMIWKVVKPMVDEVTLKKITILGRDPKVILEALLEKIPLENIPPEYGGESMPLGASPQEEDMRQLMAHHMAISQGDYSCGGRAATPPCPYCSFVPARSY